MAKAQRVECQADSLDDQGAGVAPLPEGAQLHVAGLLPGERAQVEIQHQSPHRKQAWGLLRIRHTASPARVVPACGAFGRCGGCALQHLDYPEQLRFKRDRLAHALEAAGVRPLQALPPCVAAPLPYHYRSRAKLVVAPALAPGGPLRLGAYQPRSHEFIALRRCTVMTAGLRALCEVLESAAGQQGIVGYDERTGAGELRYVLLREAESGAQQVSLVFAAWPAEDRLQALGAALVDHPELRVQGVVLHRNDTPGNVLLPMEEERGSASGDRVLRGEAALWDQIGEVRLRLSPRSFSQVQRAMAARIYADVAAALTAAPQPGELLLDLYCGVGGIGLSALRAQAPQDAELSLVGVEESAAAIADAEASAAAAGLGARARFLRGDAAESLALLRSGGAVTRAVVNPPRRGCAPQVLEALAALSPRVLAYVSCDPESLSRDLAWLTQRGYQVQRVTAYDMHPHTAHVEAVAILHRA